MRVESMLPLVCWCHGVDRMYALRYYDSRSLRVSRGSVLWVFQSYKGILALPASYAEAAYLPLSALRVGPRRDPQLLQWSRNYLRVA